MHDELLKRARKTGDVSLRSNDDTIVPNDLNRHDWKQLPRLSLRERLGNVVQLVYSLAGQWRSSLRSSVDAMVLVSLNRYDRERFNNTEPLASLDSVAHLASAMATGSRSARTSIIDSILAREARAWCGHRYYTPCTGIGNDAFLWGHASCACYGAIFRKTSVYWSLPSNMSVYYHGWQRNDILHHLCEQLSQKCNGLSSK